MQKDSACRNFAPNIFNKNKCQNCFKPRNAHSLSDKDLNKAKPVYYGWLLLAPIGSDFNNPVHKSRKWQRRWFVLFEQGALRYALDDNANTLPQGTINMNQCTEVDYAEILTGQKHSLCISLPQMKYFIRCENREDLLGWHEMLVAYPQMAKEEARIKKLKRRKSDRPRTTYTASSLHGSKDLTSPSLERNDTNSAFKIGSESTESSMNENRLLSPVESRSKVSEFSNSKESLQKKPMQKNENNNYSETQDNFGGHQSTSNNIEVSRSALSVSHDDDRKGRSISRRSTTSKQGTNSPVQPSSTLLLRRAKSLDRKAYRAASYSSDLINLKKGWMSKLEVERGQDHWTKYWFVLEQQSLKYYKDSSEDDHKEPVGEINLACLANVSQIDSQQNYSILMESSEGNHTVSAVTNGMRRNWINAISKAANLAETENVPHHRIHHDATSKENQNKSNHETNKIPSRQNRISTSEINEINSSKRQSRVRTRRKQGRSKTCDFSEFSILKSNNVGQSSEVAPCINTETDQNVHLDKIWHKIEQYKLSQEPFVIKNQDSSVVVGSLEAEVESLKNQMEKNQIKKIEMFQDLLSTQKEGPKSDPQDLDDNDFLIEQLKLEKQQAQNLKQELQTVRQELSTIKKEKKDQQKVISQQEDDNIVQCKLYKQSENELVAAKQLIKSLEGEVDFGKRRRKDLEKELKQITLKLEEQQSLNYELNQSLKLAELYKETEENQTKFDDPAVIVKDISNSKDGEMLPEESQKKTEEIDKKHLMVKECLKKLRLKVLQLKDKEEQNYDSKLPFFESDLDNAITILEQDFTATKNQSNTIDQNMPKTDDSSSESVPGSDQMLQDSRESYEAHSSNHVQKVFHQPDLSSPKEPINNLVIEDKAKVFAEQLSVQALLTVEMATILEKYENDKSSKTEVLEAIQELSTKDPKSNHHSVVLGHVDTLAEKLLVQSQFMQELLKLQNMHLKEMGQPSPRTSKENASFRSNTLYETMREKYDNDQVAALLLTHMHVSYILHVYNDRISHLSKEAKDANVRTNYYQSKLQEIIQACKTQDVEQVSMLAVESVAGGAPVQDEELSFHKQHIDYGTLHGAQANFVGVDLSNDAAFFRKLAEEVSCMSTDVKNLVDLGVKLVDINGSLSKIFNPSNVGEHVRTIAYEAISQAELLFICQRLKSDYEQELVKVNAVIQQQSECCSKLKDQLAKMEENHNLKVNDLMQQHELKVDNLKTQLDEVEMAFKKQLGKVEMLENKHKQDIHVLQEKLKLTETKLEKASYDKASEVEKLKTNLAEAKKQYENQTEEIIDQQNEKLNKVKRDSDAEIQSLRREIKLKETSLNTEKRKLEAAESRFQQERTEFEKRRQQEQEEQDTVYEEKLRHMTDDHEAMLKAVSEQWQNEMESKIQHMRSDFEHKQKEELRKFEILQENTVSLDEMEKKMKDLRQEYEEKIFVQDKCHKESMLKLTEQTLEKSEQTIQESCKDQLKELQSVYEKTFEDINQTHAKEQAELVHLHELEIQRLEEVKSREMEEDLIATKMTIDSMRRHYEETVQRLESQISSANPDQSSNVEIEDLRKKMETLSEHYTEKCIELSKLKSELVKADEKLNSNTSTESLRFRQNEIVEKLEHELSQLQMKSKPEFEDSIQHQGAMYQTQVKLRVKQSEIDLLNQELKSFEQQLDTAIQDKRYYQQKHKCVFEELTALKSRDFARNHNTHEDSESNYERNSKKTGHDVMKSKSQPSISTLSGHSDTSFSTKQSKSDRNHQVTDKSST